MDLEFHVVVAVVAETIVGRRAGLSLSGHITRVTGITHVEIFVVVSI